MSIKKIQINLDAFQQTKAKKNKTIKPGFIINQNSLKTQLLNKIKQHKNKEKKDITISLKPEVAKNAKMKKEEIMDEFSESLHYLSDIAKIPTTTPSISNNNTALVELDFPENYNVSEKPKSLESVYNNAYDDDDDDEKVNYTSVQYAISKDDTTPGCLKNGLKQTYRQFTRKQRPSLALAAAAPPPALAPPAPAAEHASIAATKIFKKKTHRKVTLGKIGKKVSVLIKNAETRKKITNAHKDLKQAPLSDVKKYLKDHFLLKVGSNAPSDVLRNMYESAKLAGELTNRNEETLLHNFINKSET